MPLPFFWGGRAARGPRRVRLGLCSSCLCIAVFLQALCLSPNLQTSRASGAPVGCEPVLWGGGEPPVLGYMGTRGPRRAQSSGRSCAEGGCQPGCRARQPAECASCLMDEVSRGWVWLLGTTKSRQGMWDAGDHCGSGDELLRS